MARTRRATAAPAPAATVTMTPAAMRQAIAEGVNAILDERAAAQQAQNGGIGVQAAPAAHYHLTLWQYRDAVVDLLWRYEVTAGDTPYTSAARFEDLNISHELLKGLYVAMQFERPSKVQSITLPMILSPLYKSLVAQAHNGSGKTTCFALGMLSRVDPKMAAPQAICICPTRELAIQNYSFILDWSFNVLVEFRIGDSGCLKEMF
ncbi:DEAD-box ATP-dependent RNA helicase 38 [Artemisia annua]|uniref:ATP-dependent RNA helicase n=1 Tax=Artemisia annua TaxID=35608 RepID=A0A2U1Q6W3_ARTAN|nr:DEAD-box ATP-dependent RNA helicase 38 [Artemisia annua]